MKKCGCALFYCFVSIPLAFGFSGANDLYLGAGSLTQFVKKVQVDESGTQNEFQFNPMIQGGANITLRGRMSLLPEFSFTLPKSGRDKNIKRFTYHMLAPLGLPYKSFLFRAGLGLSLTRISGPGGEETLGNGTSSTSFPLPTEASTSQNIIVLVGAEYEFLKSWSGRVETFCFNPFDNLNRAFSYTLSIQYHFGAIDWKKKPADASANENKKSEGL